MFGKLKADDVPDGLSRDHRRTGCKTLLMKQPKILTDLQGEFFFLKIVYIGFFSTVSFQGIRCFTQIFSINSRLHGGVFNIPEHVGKVYREQGVKVEISYEGEWLTGSTIELMEVRVDELIGGAQGLGTLWGQKTHPIGSKEMAKKKQVLYGIVLSFLIDFS